jgi:hypothetical protein
MGEGFFLITPTEVRGLRIALPLAIIDCRVYWLSGNLPHLPPEKHETFPSRWSSFSIYKLSGATHCGSTQ